MYILLDPGGYPMIITKDRSKVVMELIDIDKNQERPDIADMCEIIDVSGAKLLGYRILSLTLKIRFKLKKFAHVVCLL